MIINKWLKSAKDTFIPLEIKVNLYNKILQKYFLFIALMPFTIFQTQPSLTN